MKTAKIKMLNIFLSMFLMSFGASASTKTYYGCLVVDYLYQGKKIDLTQPCQITRALTLTTGTMNYPKLSNNPYQVEFWRGEVSKDVITTFQYKRYVTNWCTGQQISEQNVETPRTNVINFQIENPNLSEEISKSYELVPMTEDEAKIEFQNQMQQCQNYKN
jgi:hypothetical protein